jgi:hypothetical protein
VSVRNGTNGYSRLVARSLKSGVAVAATVFFLLFGAEVAQAGGISDIVDDAVAPAENALPKAEEAGLGDVVGDATVAVDEAAGAVDAEDVVTDTKGAVDGVVADPRGTVENTVEQVSGTVDDVAGDARRIADSSPVDRAAKGVTDTVDSLASGAAKSEVSRSGATAAAPASRSVIAAPNGAETRSLRPVGTSRSSDGAIKVGTIVSKPADSTPRALPSRTSLPFASDAWTDAFSAPVGMASDNASSAAPAAPFGPPAPGDQPATAASAAGATGAALLAVLFSALLFLAPRAGRLARPGPILVRAEPCLSLLERPG